MPKTQYDLKCPACESESLEVFGSSGKIEVADFVGSSMVNKLFEIMKTAAYAECSSCGKTLDDDELDSFLEKTLIEGE
jgi:Zn finger protein HypA/HybF involved in hydrogenase expression